MCRDRNPGYASKVCSALRTWLSYYLSTGGVFFVPKACRSGRWTGHRAIRVRPQVCQNKYISLTVWYIKKPGSHSSSFSTVSSSSFLLRYRPVALLVPSFIFRIYSLGCASVSILPHKTKSPEKKSPCVTRSSSRLRALRLLVSTMLLTTSIQYADVFF